MGHRRPLSSPMAVIGNGVRPLGGRPRPSPHQIATIQRTAGNAALVRLLHEDGGAALSGRHSSRDRAVKPAGFASNPSVTYAKAIAVQRIQPESFDDGPGAEAEITWERPFGQLAVRFQGKAIVLGTGSGTVKGSKVIVKRVAKRATSWSSGVTARLLTLDLLATKDIVGDLCAALGLERENVGNIALEIKVGELDLKESEEEEETSQEGEKRRGIAPDFSLMKVELSVQIDATELAAQYSPDVSRLLREATENGYDLCLRGQLGIQWNVPLWAVLRRHPHLAAFGLGALVALGLVARGGDALVSAIEATATKVAVAAELGQHIARIVERAAFAFFERPIFEVLLMADPENMNFDDEVTDDEIGVITRIGLDVQQKLLGSADGIAANKAARSSPMSSYAGPADMAIVSSAIHRIAGPADSDAPRALLELTPAAFFDRLWWVGILTWADDPELVGDVLEDRYLSGDWTPSAASELR
jgi:hypothetical protein